jgi:hypothetical protein
MEEIRHCRDCVYYRNHDNGIVECTMPDICDGKRYWRSVLNIHPRHAKSVLLPANPSWMKEVEV